MRSALAHSWDYFEEEEAYRPASRVRLVEAAPVLEDLAEAAEFYPDETLAAPVPLEGIRPVPAYAFSFSRPQPVTLTLPAAPNFGYAYDYRQSLRPRRAKQVPLLDAVLEWGKALPGRSFQKVALLGGGLILGWFLVQTLFSFVGHGQPAANAVYAFNGAASASIANANAKNEPLPQGHVLTNNPTIEPTKIDAVLKQYNSPAVGAGQAFYDLGKRYGIDPAYALAFFIHESSAGTQGVAASTKSIGNIRCTPGYDCLQTAGNGSFRRYASWQAGAEDWFKLIKDLYVGEWGLKTLEQIIPRYAPSADHNSPDTYIQQVAQLVDSWRSGK